METLRRSNLVIVWLALAGALALRSLVPTGWMPMVSGGEIRIMLCDGAGPVELTAPAADLQIHGAHSQHGGQHEAGQHEGGQHEGGDHENAPHDACPFGLALGHALDVPAPPPVPVSLQHSASIAGPSLIAALIAARRALRPPARGPPAFA